jgi:hypothetical protein
VSGTEGVEAREAVGRPMSGGRFETRMERYDRNYNELLQELRVAQTGTQILFAFLLATAFTANLQQSDAFARRLLAVTLVLAACSTALLIAPVAVHRATFQRRLKAELVRAASQLARGGLLFLMLAMIGACLLALDAVLARSTAVAVTTGVLVVFAGLWIVLPAVLRRTRGSVEDEPPER